MQYKDWIIALYDDFYDIKHKDDKKLKFCDYWNAFTDKENRRMVCFMCLIIFVFLLFIFSIINEIVYMITMVFSTMIIMLLETQKYRITLENYKKNIDLLKNVLIKQHLYDLDIIDILIRETGGFFIN